MTNGTRNPPPEAARKVSSGFPIFYPTRLPSGARYVESSSYEHVQDPRVYHFKDTDGKRHVAYRMVAVLDQTRVAIEPIVNP